MKQKSSSVLRVGLIGCGAISHAYFLGLSSFSKVARITACADLDETRAKARADEQRVAKACSVAELLQDPEIDAVLNLTTPQAHAEINLAALRAGKHVYCEKPFSLNVKEGLRVMAEAKKRKLRVGCAPDTVLGAGIQTCRKLIDEGAIGKPIAATANVLCHGHESWHPNPAFFYQAGAGPIFDIGPYYFASLLTLIGPAISVSASAKTTFKERVITSQPLRGRKIKVEIPTHLTGVVEFGGGVLATVTMSYDVWPHHLPLLEVYGTEGSLSCPDPNHFTGEVSLWTQATKEWRKISPPETDRVERGCGLVEMAYGILHRRPHRMSGEMGLHGVDIMENFHRSASLGRKIFLKTTCPQPSAVTTGLPLATLS